jgi:hypothetical protein
MWILPVRQGVRICSSIDNRIDAAPALSAGDGLLLSAAELAREIISTSADSSFTRDLARV